MEDVGINEGGPDALRQGLVIRIPIPESFAHDEALQRLASLIIQLLSSGMPERELAKRLMRYHPAVEG